MNVGDLVRVVRSYDFVNSYVQDVEVYTVHPSMSLHGMHEIFEVKTGTLGIVLDVYTSPATGGLSWTKVLFSRALGWTDAEHLEVVRENVSPPESFFSNSSV